MLPSHFKPKSSRFTLLLALSLCLTVFSGQSAAQKFRVFNDSHRHLHIKVYKNSDKTHAGASDSAFVERGKSTGRLKCPAKRCKIRVYGAYKDQMGVWKRRNKYIQKKRIKHDVTIEGEHCGKGLSCLTITEG